MIEWIVSSGALILIVTALRFLLKGKIALRLQYALWALVLLRLLAPVSFGESSLSVMNAVAEKNTDYYIWHADSGEVTRPESDAGEQTVIQPGVSLEPSTVEFPVNTAGIPLDRILYGVWITGIAGAAALLLFFNLRFTVRLKRSRQTVEAECEGAILPVYLSEVVETPCLFGLFRPAIYVTPEVFADPTALRHILAHETTHYRHRDHIWALLRCVCLALHWYNPLVWLAAILSRRDSELACDEGTIRRIGEKERINYGCTLVGLTCTKRGTLLTTATTMNGSKHGIKERITLIAKKPKMTVYTLIAVLLIAVAAVSCTFTGAMGDTPWRWAKELSAKDVDSAMIWGNFGEYDLSDAEIEEVINAINRLNRFDFEENSKSVGPTPESGLVLMCGEEQFYINQAGYLEMRYGEKQWWIKDDQLDAMFTSLLTENTTPEQVNARGWIAGMDNLRINVYASNDAKLLVDGAVVDESGEALYSADGNQFGTVWYVGGSGQKIYALYNGDYKILADGEVKIEYMNSGYFDKVVEYTSGNASAAYHIGNYSSMEISCEATINSTGVNETITIQPYHTYSESELNALNQD